MEGSTGFDTEFVLAGEPVPQPIFGFAAAHQHPDAGRSGHIKGMVNGIKHYTPPKGGSFDSLGRSCRQPRSTIRSTGPGFRWLTCRHGDVAVWIGQGNPDGSFEIPNVPARQLLAELVG